MFMYKSQLRIVYQLLKLGLDTEDGILRRKANDCYVATFKIPTRSLATEMW